MVLLFNVLLFEIIGSVNQLSSVKRLISSSRWLNKNASFSCTIIFFNIKRNPSSISFASNSTVHLLHCFQCKWNITGIIVICVNYKNVTSFVSYFNVRPCCSFMKLDLLKNTFTLSSSLRLAPSSEHLVKPPQL